MKKPPDPASFLLHLPLCRSQKPLSLSFEAFSGSMSPHHPGKEKVIVVTWGRRNVIVPEARSAFSRVRSGNRVHNCDLLGPVPELLLFSNPLPSWESHLLPEVFDSLVLAKIYSISKKVFDICVFQVCGLILHPDLCLSKLLGSFLATLSLCISTEFMLMSLCFGHAHCYVFIDYHLAICFRLCFDLKLVMAASCGEFWTGFFEVLPLNMEPLGSNYLSPVAPLLDLARCSIIRHCGILMVLFIIRSLLGSLYQCIACSCILGLSIKNHIFSVCGKLLFCFKNLDACSQIQNCYPNFCVVASIVPPFDLDLASLPGLLVRIKNWNCYINAQFSCWPLLWNFSFEYLEEGMFLCIVSDRGCPWLLLSLLWLLLSCIWVLLVSDWFTVFCWYRRCCSLSPSLSINEMLVLGCCRLSFLYVSPWISLLTLAHIGFSELVCSNLWHGFALGFGCVVDPSVAPSFGEQPWLIAPYSRHICPNGLRMNSPFPETFLDWLLHPRCAVWSTSTLFPTGSCINLWCGSYDLWLTLLGCEIILVCVCQNEIVLLALCYLVAATALVTWYYLHYLALVLSCVYWPCRAMNWICSMHSSGGDVRGRAHTAVVDGGLPRLHFDFQPSLEFQCDTQVIDCSSLAVQFLPKNECTVWWHSWSVIMLGEATSGCMRLQAQQLQMQEITQFKAFLSWLGNSPTMICCSPMHIVFIFQIRYVLQICVIAPFLNKICSMASEDIWQFQPYDTSKAYPSTAYGLRTNFVVVRIWVRVVGLNGNLSPTSKASLHMCSSSNRKSFVTCQHFLWLPAHNVLL
uniref:Uncharacterized protein n=2 Tax=Opuntia streptacantha TaxID=393608 RepID=A0A7C9AZH3_OPUST